MTILNKYWHPYSLLEMTNTEKPLPPKKQRSAEIERLERALRDADISSEEYQALREELRKNRKRNEGAGDNPLDNLYDEP